MDGSTIHRAVVFPLVRCPWPARPQPERVVVGAASVGLRRILPRAGVLASLSPRRAPAQDDLMRHAYLADDLGKMDVLFKRVGGTHATLV